MCTLRHALAAATALVLCSGCWADFPADLLNADGGDATVDRPGDFPGTEGGLEGGPDTTRDGAGDSDTSSDGGVDGDGAPPDQTGEGVAPDQTVDGTPDQTVDSSVCGQPCPLGCNTTAARCNRLAPSNFTVAAFYGSLSADIDISANTTFNAETGLVRAGVTTLRAAGDPGTVKNGIYWATVNQGGAYPQLGVFAMRSLRVRSGATVDIGGANAAAFYTAGNITIEGTVRAAAVARAAGAGGYDGGAPDTDAPTCFGGEGQAGNVQASSRESGGGGGGRGDVGGRGGNVTGGSGASGGPAGSANGTITLIPLYGGCGGGGGARNVGAGAGGGGGGAIQLSADGTITISGVVTAPGAGGRGSTASEAGGGGGSGGAILLEGHAVSISGIVAANGGGGGAGGTGVTNNGQNGRASTARANGGTGPGGSNGGRGGARTPTSGEAGQTDATNAGGGGGAAGRLRVNAPTFSGAANTSPAASTSATPATF